MDKKQLEPIYEILDAISEIQESLQGMGFHDYRTNRRLKIQTVSNLNRIIESAESIPVDVKTEFKDFPWDFINDFVSGIVGGQYGLDENTLWKVVKIELRHLEKLINSLFFKN